jgi:hypothetical protein
LMGKFSGPARIQFVKFSSHQLIPGGSCGNRRLSVPIHGFPGFFLVN